MKRKIYIGKTYTTKQGSLFTVVKVVKGKQKYNFQHPAGREERRALDKDGNRIRISNLLKVIE